jgi:hypothetical protein
MVVPKYIALRNFSEQNGHNELYDKLIIQRYQSFHKQLQPNTIMVLTIVIRSGNELNLGKSCL